MKAKTTILQTAVYNFHETAKRLRLKDYLIEKLSEPKEKIEITMDPALANLQIKHVKGFIVRHTDALGPSKGGIRMDSTITCDDICGLAMEMSWKTALIGVPFGGGKSGICFDSASVDESGKETIIRSFTRAAKRHIGPEVYIPAPDMGTNESDMGHIRDCISYSDGTSITKGCFVTGKPVIVGGIVGRREATGRGVVYSTLAACEKLGIDIKNATVAVQGFGNVGAVAAETIAECGAKIIGISDVTGALYNPQGFDIKELMAHSVKAGSVEGFDGSQRISNKELLELDCDILIPAATQSQITVENASKIKAKIVSEGANSPTTPEADDILNEKGIFVIPDILCNAGGVFVSYLEYTQETQREQTTIEQVQDRLSRRMNNRFGQVYGHLTEKGGSMRQAAMDIAVGTVVDALNARGVLP